MLEEFEATEELPVRIFHPACDDLLIRQVMNVLEVVQADHQPGRLRRPADRPVEAAKGFVKARPGYQPGQSHQCVVRIDDCLQPLAEQIDLAGWWTGWTHRKTPEKARSSRRYRHFPILHNTRESLKNKDSWPFSGPTKERRQAARSRPASRSRWRLPARLLD